MIINLIHKYFTKKIDKNINNSIMEKYIPLNHGIKQNILILKKSCI